MELKLRMSCDGSSAKRGTRQEIANDFQFRLESRRGERARVITPCVANKSREESRRGPRLFAAFSMPYELGLPNSPD